MQAELITHETVDRLVERAEKSPRRRLNLNFHRDHEEPCHRLLNAVEPFSYVRPHRHASPTKDETAITVRGSFGVVLFDHEGRVTESLTMTAGGDAFGVNIPHGVYHTFMALEPGSVFFEAKAGPFQPLTEDEIAPWSPPPDDPSAESYWRDLRKRCFEEK